MDAPALFSELVAVFISCNPIKISKDLLDVCPKLQRIDAGSARSKIFSALPDLFRLAVPNVTDVATKDFQARADESNLACLPRKRWSWKSWLLIIGIGIVCASLIPPLQSPDEGDHVTRASLLAQGTFLLQTPAGESSGGMIDLGLANYISLYSKLWYRPDQKATPELKSVAESIEWSGNLVFRSAPGTGYYFPGIYLPQALGLKAGQLMHLSVDSSYRLARVLTMVCASILLIVAFEIIPPSLLTLALLVLPMTLFQFASATIDATSIALTVLALSWTFQVAQARRVTGLQLLGIGLSVFLVITSRPHMLPLLGLLLAVYFLTRNKAALLAAAITTLASMLWVLSALQSVVDLRVKLSSSSSEIALNYIQHPAALWKIFHATFTNPFLPIFYQQSFLGILGWLDTPLPDGIYTSLSGLTLGITVLSVAVPRQRAQLTFRGALLLGALVSCGLIFFLLLVTWTPTDANTIQGVQGRYFLLPALVLSYALHDPLTAYRRRGTLYHTLALTLLILMGLLIANVLPKVLVERYALISTPPLSLQALNRTQRIFLKAPNVASHIL